jgi:hypothetical protein
MPVGQWQTQIFRDICGRCGAAPGVEAVNDSPLPAALVFFILSLGRRGGEWTKHNERVRYRAS